MIKQDQKNSKIYLLFSNVEKDFLTDYIQQTARVLSQNYFTIVAYYTKPHSLGSLLSNPVRLLEIFKGWKKIIFSKEKGVYQCEFVSIVPFQRFLTVYEKNKRLTKTQLKILLFLKRLFNKKKFDLVLWLFNPTAEFFVGALGEKLSLYDGVDYLELIPGQGEELEKQEVRLLGKADLIFANSKPLAASKKKYRKDIIVVPCGCDIDSFPLNFRPKIKPDKLKKIRKPIVGFFGHIDHRIDFRLVEYLLDKNPELSFVFIGKTLTKETQETRKKKSVGNFLAKLKEYKNFYLLAPMAKEELKNYLYFFDLAIIPYETKLKFVCYSNPMKFYEYLAIGKPVVSTPIPSLKKYRLPTIKFARSFEEFGSSINYLLINQPKLLSKFKKEMRMIAEKNSWQRKVAKIEKKLNIL